MGEKEGKGKGTTHIFPLPQPLLSISSQTNALHDVAARGLTEQCYTRDFFPHIRSRKKGGRKKDMIAGKGKGMFAKKQQYEGKKKGRRGDLALIQSDRGGGRKGGVGEEERREGGRRRMDRQNGLDIRRERGQKRKKCKFRSCRPKISLVGSGQTMQLIELKQSIVTTKTENELDFNHCDFSKVTRIHPP